MLKKIQKTKADLEKQRVNIESQFQQILGALAVCDKLMEEETSEGKKPVAGPDNKKS
tara:strand:- start:139 stop:309 length:171 start_codon:yes stop_codon:yes gene_type:complete